jgi:hypothetical protein
MIFRLKNDRNEKIKYSPEHSIEKSKRKIKKKNRKGKIGNRPWQF